MVGTALSEAGGSTFNWLRTGGRYWAGRLDTTAYAEAVAGCGGITEEGTRAKAAWSGGNGAIVKGGVEFTGCVASRGGASYAKGAEQRGPAEDWFPDAIGSCSQTTRLLSSTAGCGKPHVRWCGRVTGRNPRHSTRSYCGGGGGGGGGAPGPRAGIGGGAAGFCSP